MDLPPGDQNQGGQRTYEDLQNDCMTCVFYGVFICFSSCSVPFAYPLYFLFASGLDLHLPRGKGGVHTSLREALFQRELIGGTSGIFCGQMAG